MSENWSCTLPERTVLDGRYRICRVLGMGGFGITYEAADEKVHRQVAVKELFARNYMERKGENSFLITLQGSGEKQEFEAVKQEFLQEARTVSNFSEEPGVVEILDYFEENNTAYLVMEYLDGTSLERYFGQEGLMAAGELFAMMIPLMETLDKIHRCGVIHRDISPDNIMVMGDPGTDDGSVRRLKLIDFGSARDYMKAQSYTVELKNGYAPPEQYSETDAQGPWTDIYALCGTIYRGITGQKPLPSAVRRFHDDLKMPSELGISIDPGLEKILKKGLSIQPKDRYQSMGQMLWEVKLRMASGKKTRGGGKKFLAACAMSGAAVLIGLAGYRYKHDHRVELFFGYEKTETILLTPDETMSSREYREAADIVRQRMDVLTGEDGYLMEIRETGLEITLPLSFFEGDSLTDGIEKKVKKYLSQQLKTYVTLVERGENGTHYEMEPIERDDVACVEKKEGEPPVEYHLPEDMSAGYSHDAENGYWEIHLTEEAGSRLKEKMQEKLQNDPEDYMMLVVDPGSWDRKKYAFYTDPDGDWTVFYQNCGENSGERWKLFWEIPPLASALEVKYEIPADWEEKSGMWGEYQRQVGQIEEPAVTLLYGGDYDQAMTDGAWGSQLYELKYKADALQKPYAVGTVPDGSGRIVLRMAQQDCNEFIGRELAAKQQNVWLCDGTAEDLGNSDYFRKFGELELKKGQDGTWILDYEIGENELEKVQAWEQELLDDGKDSLYLAAGGYLLARMELSSVTQTGSHEFRENLWSLDGCFEEEDLPLLRLLERAQNTESDGYITGVYCLEAQYSSAEHRVEVQGQTQNRQLVPRSDELQRIGQVLGVLNPQAGVRESRGYVNELDICLHMDLDKAYAEKMIETMRQLFETCGEDLAYYGRIVWYPGSSENGQHITIAVKKGKRELFYYRGMDSDPEQQAIMELLKESNLFREYLTEESFRHTAWW